MCGLYGSVVSVFPVVSSTKSGQPDNKSTVCFAHHAVHKSTGKQGLSNRMALSEPALTQAGQIEVQRQAPLEAGVGWQWGTSRVMPSITWRGSMTLPSDLDILRPWASRTMECRYTCLKGTCPASHHPSHIQTSRRKRQTTPRPTNRHRQTDRQTGTKKQADRQKEMEFKQQSGEDGILRMSMKSSVHAAAAAVLHLSCCHGQV